MNTPRFSYPGWQTVRTILRRYVPTDKWAFLNLWSDPVIQRWSFIEGLSLERTEQFLQSTIESMDKGSTFFVVVEDKEQHEVIGHVSLNFKSSQYPKPGGSNDADSDASVGIALNARYRGRGFGTEVMHWVITHGFRELGLRQISLTVLENNIPAVKMYRKM
jgi:RimJ/RimL family protein N-acetyltransferase